MIVGFSRHGRGYGAKPVAYLTAETVGPARAPLEYLTGQKGRTGVRRNPLPVVLRGDPEKTRALIDSLDFKYKYTSGVLSFAPGETITPEAERKIISEFEQTAFAGLKTGDYDFLLVRHTHAGHHEVHFIAPRVELSTGKSLNIAPPGKASRELFDTFRSKINLEFGLADPDDPARARAVRVPSFAARLKARESRAGNLGKQDLRESVAAGLQDLVRGGQIKTRNDMLAALREQGFLIPRAGKDFITIEDAAGGQRVRLRGNLFSEKPSLVPATPEDSKRTLAGLKEKLEHLTEARARYNQKRYGSREPEKELTTLLRECGLARLNQRAPKAEHDRTRESSFACLEGFGARLHGARARTKHLGLGLNRAARRFHDAGCGFERGIGEARDARQHLDRAVAGASDRFAQLRERAVNQEVLQKYGALSLSARGRAKEREMEMEMERPL